MKNLSLTQIIENIKNWTTTPEKVWEYFNTRIDKYDEKLWCYNFRNTQGLTTDTNTVLAWAPIWIKDIFCENWIPTTCGSKMLQDFKPPYDSTVITNLKNAWMSSIWKLNMDEFAMWSTTESSALNRTVNPWWTNRIPWGSSWGSAAAVAWGLCPASLGTDTGWSIRQPASVCWIVWFKPSYGRNSRYWVIPMASSLDCPGTLTRTVKDAGLLYEIMNGHDIKENTSLETKDIIDPSIWDRKDLKWVKVWIPKEYFEEWLDAWVKTTILTAIEKLKELWAEIVDISLPMTKYAVATYYILMPAEVSTNLWRIDWLRYGHVSEKTYSSMDEFYCNNRWEWFGDEAQRRIVLWSYVLSAWYYDAYYKKAWQIRTLIIEDFKKAFEKVDVIVGPASPSVAWKMWEKLDDPLKMYLSDAYTIPASLAGLPCISVPCGFAQSEDADKETLPVWLQFICAQFEDQKTLEISNVYETQTEWSKAFPTWYED